MPSNDTQNVYSTPFNEGEAQPIPASRISYDGTGTSIEATNVQAAITEVDTDLQSTKDDVNDIKGELRDMSLNGYAITDFLSVEYTPVENDTYGTSLDALADLMNDVISALEDDEMIVANNIVITSVATLICRNTPHYNTDSNFNAVAFSLNASTTALSIFAAVIYGGSGNSYIDKLDTATNLAFQNITSNSLTATNKLRLSYYKYKKIKTEG